MFADAPAVESVVEFVESAIGMRMKEAEIGSGR
jgi:hypothetical protein